MKNIRKILVEITQVKNVIDAPTIVFYQNLACDEIDISHLLSECKLTKLNWHIGNLSLFENIQLKDIVFGKKS